MQLKVASIVHGQYLCSKTKRLPLIKDLHLLHNQIIGAYTLQYKILILWKKTCFLYFSLAIELFVRPSYEFTALQNPEWLFYYIFNEDKSIIKTQNDHYYIFHVDEFRRSLKCVHVKYDIMACIWRIKHIEMYNHEVSKK